MQMVLQDAPVAGGRGWMNQEWVVVVVEACFWRQGIPVEWVRVGFKGKGHMLAVNQM